MKGRSMLPHRTAGTGIGTRRRFIGSAAAAFFFSRGAWAQQCSPRCRTIYVGGHTRHASIIVDRRDFDPGRSIASPGFLTKDWLEFGWGDADFYQAKGESVLLGLKALLLPTDTVVHVHGFNGAPAANFPKTEIIELRLTAADYADLLEFLKASFARDAAGNVEPLGRGLYDLSEFYVGTGTYSLFRTCNTWAAEALAAGGFPIDPADVGTVDQFMEQVRGKTEAGCGTAGP